MPFEQYISEAEQAEIRQVIGNVASGTFGQHPISFINKTIVEGQYGESPVETDVESELVGLILTPDDAVRIENVERAQIDWDAQIMLSRDYIDEQGLLDDMRPDSVTRQHEWVVDGIRYRVKRYRWDAQFVTDQLLIFVDLERK